MQIIDAETVDRVLDEAGLADALRDMFRDGCEQPVRHHHTVDVPDQPDATLLLMPAWQPGQALGVKVATVFPGNSAKSLPAVQANYLLLDPQTGIPRALVDGWRLTVWRTAAASGLAARYLARRDAEVLLMVGAGALAPMLIRAHLSARPSLKHVQVWNHRPAGAVDLAARLPAMLAETFPARAVTVEAVADLDAAVPGAAVVSAATLSRKPLIRGDLLSPGTHVDLVGAFTPEMRESDDCCLQRASVFVDTRAGALKEAGDLVIPLGTGAFQPEDVAAEMAELVREEHPGRSGPQEITLFKSVGAAMEDLAGARLVAARAGR